MLVTEVIPTDVLRLIAEYAIEPPLRVRAAMEWDDNLLCNPMAMAQIEQHVLENGVTLSILEYLVQNPNPKVFQYITPSLIEMFPEIMNNLCEHPSVEAIDLVREHPQKNWSLLCSNPAAIDLIRDRPDRWYISSLLKNPASYDLVERILLDQDCVLLWRYAMHSLHADRLLSTHRDRLPPSVLEVRWGSRADSIHLFDERPMDCWVIEEMVVNPNPGVLPYIDQWFEQFDIEEDPVNYRELMEDMCLSPHHHVLDRVDLQYACSDSLSRNPQAIDILLEHPEHIRWEALAENPSNRVMEVVLEYQASFLASRYRGRMYRRPDILEVDEEKMRDKVKNFISMEI